MPVCDYCKKEVILCWVSVTDLYDGSKLSFCNKEHYEMFKKESAIVSDGDLDSNSIFDISNKDLTKFATHIRDTVVVSLSKQGLIKRCIAEELLDGNFMISKDIDKKSFRHLWMAVITPNCDDKNELTTYFSRSIKGWFKS